MLYMICKHSDTFLQSFIHVQFFCKNHRMVVLLLVKGNSLRWRHLVATSVILYQQHWNHIRTCCTTLRDNRDFSVFLVHILVQKLVYIVCKHHKDRRITLPRRIISELGSQETFSDTDCPSTIIAHYRSHGFSIENSSITSTYSQGQPSKR